MVRRPRGFIAPGRSPPRLLWASGSGYGPSDHGRHVSSNTAGAAYWQVEFSRRSAMPARKPRRSPLRPVTPFWRRVRLPPNAGNEARKEAGNMRKRTVTLLATTAGILLTVLASEHAGQLAAQGPELLTPIAYPGAIETAAYGVNSRGEIVGSWGPPPLFGGPYRGYRFAHGKYELLDLSQQTGYANTWPRGLNGRGDIVGYISTSSGIGDRGFILRTRSSRNWLELVDHPGASGTRLSGVNDVGEIVGEFTDASGERVGFLLVDGVFTELHRPEVDQAIPYAITNDGRIVGFSDTAHGGSGFLMDGGVYITVSYPGAESTKLRGINARGDIVGEYVGQDGWAHGFVLRDCAFMPYDHPAAIGGSVVSGINDAGVVIGMYTEKLFGPMHSFTSGLTRSACDVAR